VIPLVMRTLGLELRRTGYAMRPVHLGLLATLAEGQHNLSELAERWAVSRPTMSNSVTALVERGWVSRVRDPHDRRMVLIEVTPAGRAVLEEMRSAAEMRLAELLASLSPEECEELLTGLAVLRAVFDRVGESSQGSDRQADLP
jgi:DNA-binding MarR family transcriptional regulator